ncbi:MAG: dihydropteroate synthase [Gammaproteobacteria bacterium]|nr:dihydropteroate synthase [Gammaproteobacteria bacterium]NIN61526.1 dihydropteroate synthase [Gammaproteobacteria bacterium]NIO62720.1 dihydropteroate synthase [Gammaproteobacteria bacterium]NIQ09640.1 dihydropteroate synthase [Gammaproteobacteria bacterium]NIQ19284.1 dihydropteroate synthase [Gammaproteobacteria bacterium]
MSNNKLEHILFLTGKLAEKRLHKVVASMKPTNFTYEIRNIGVSVAALMTADMLKRRLQDLDAYDRIIVPGLCRGDLDKASQTLGVEVVRGTEDLKDLPGFFGHKCQPVDLSRYDVSIFAEITDAPQIGLEAIMARAKQYRLDGADVIDIGCLPDTPFPHLEEAVAALKQAGYRVSVDSLDVDDLLRGGKAGADYLLSLNESTLWVTDEVDSVPVLIPEPHKDMASLYRAIDYMRENKRPCIADSILDPIHFGFTDSILRYHELRQRYPDVEIMMGIGNLTELTEADTTGINALLFGMISELRITQVLATEVSPHTCSAVREADRARRIMFAARTEESLPKGLDSGLLSTHALKPFPYSKDEIEELAAEIRDPSYRVQISKGGIHVYNRDGFSTAANPFELFPELELIQDDAPHAFYMGVELARAQVAWQLGKRYQQDEELEWGVATRGSSEAEKNRLSRAAHRLKGNSGNADGYKEAGSTLKASRARKKKQKK